MNGWPVQVDNLTVRYGRTVAVDRLSVDFRPGAITGLLGRNGSGKTSLLSAIASFLPPSAGRIVIDGKDAFENPQVSPHVCLMRDVGDFEEARLSHVLATVGRLRPAWNPELALRLAERFGLDLRRTATALSRGQRSALGAVVGIASRAPVTMFDETYLGMDPHAREIFYEELLNDYLAAPRTIILSTHLIGEIERLFEHVVIIDRGRLLLDAPADDLRAEHGSIHDTFLHVTREQAVTA